MDTFLQTTPKLKVNELYMLEISTPTQPDLEPVVIVGRWLGPIIGSGITDVWTLQLDTMQSDLFEYSLPQLMARCDMLLIQDDQTYEEVGLKIVGTVDTCWCDNRYNHIPAENRP